jgi:reverse gyrase
MPIKADKVVTTPPTKKPAKKFEEQRSSASQQQEGVKGWIVQRSSEYYNDMLHQGEQA